MTDAGWHLIERDFNSACEHFSKAVHILGRGRFDGAGLEGHLDSMAFMHAMQAGQADLENGLLRILSLLGEERPRKAVSWREDLLEQVAMEVAGRAAVLPADIAEHAQETRRFWNVAVRTYNRFATPKARPAVLAARILAERLPRCLRDFRNVMDPPEPPQHDGGGGGMSGGPG